jgi:hypothetical protein
MTDQQEHEPLLSAGFHELSITPEQIAQALDIGLWRTPAGKRTPTPQRS